jgi:hypothetical protein
MLKPETVYSSRKELMFSKLDTAIMVATAGGDGIARGETISDMHLSEIAFWLASAAAENLNGLLQSSPTLTTPSASLRAPRTGSTCSRSFGMALVSGENEFEPFFAAWFETPEYRMPVPEGFERTLEEEDLAALYGSRRRAAWYGGAADCGIWS